VALWPDADLFADYACKGHHERPAGEIRRALHPFGDVRHEGPQGLE
jgi:hypothetical protein